VSGAGKLILVSNRLPVTVVRKGDRLRLQQSTGGLATALASLHKVFGGAWVGWPGITSDRVEGSNWRRVEEELRREGLVPVLISESLLDGYYNGFANRTLWPLFHYFPQYAVFDESFWRAYVKVNELFKEEVLSIAKPTDIIWVHDYHLMLLPKMIRKEIPDATIGFFLHIPFPSFELFRTLPWRRELLEGVLGADLIGFHNYDYMRHFMSSVKRGLSINVVLNTINYDGRLIRVDAFPLGIDYERFRKAVQDPKVRRRAARIRRRLGKAKVIFSIDRLDYTKGIVQRLEAYDYFLEKHPEFRGKVVYVLAVSPSRTRVKHYTELKRRIDELVGMINGKYGEVGWNPIYYLYRYISFEELLAYYLAADVAFILPLRDGMNLVAKEFVASKTDGKGALILSETAGAAAELVEALIVNPNSKEEVAEALRRAVTMHPKEQERRLRSMQERVRRYNLMRWANDFLEGLAEAKKEQIRLRMNVLKPKNLEEMVERYSSAGKRLFLLDYDGTLVPFASRPEEAVPDEEIIELLSRLASVEGNEVVIVSGRDKNTLEEWFGNLPVGLVAEHGALVKRRGGDWEVTVPQDLSWKDAVRQVLEYYVDRTPGSFIEEKEFSIVWHYRNVDPELAELRANELKDTLSGIIQGSKLAVLQGSKVIEVRHADVNKGVAVRRWLDEGGWDFILAAGDDWTDEDMFKVLPDYAYSIKVGIEATEARFNVPSHEDVRKVLSTLLNAGHYGVGAK